MQNGLNLHHIFKHTKEAVKIKRKSPPQLYADFIFLLLFFYARVGVGAALISFCTPTVVLPEAVRWIRLALRNVRLPTFKRQRHYKGRLLSIFK